MAVVNLSPGRGDACNPVDGDALLEGQFLHFHVDGKGCMRVFHGMSENCPQFREFMRKKLEELQK